jgi:hypothetical protein
MAFSNALSAVALSDKSFKATPLLNHSLAVNCAVAVILKNYISQQLFAIPGNT